MIAGLNYSEEEILRKIASLNSNSEHPLAQAVLAYAGEKGVEVKEISRFEAITGKGVVGEITGNKLALGNEKLMEQVKAVISPELQEQVKKEQRKNGILFS